MINQNDYLYRAWVDAGSPPGVLEFLDGTRMHESAGKINAKSNRGAYGPFQMLESTFKANAAPGHTNWKDPYDSARAAINYVQHLQKKAHGNVWLTAIGYYGGDGAIDKALKGTAVYDPKNPTYPSTMDYGNETLARWNGDKSLQIKDLVGRTYNRGKNVTWVKGEGANGRGVSGMASFNQDLAPDTTGATAKPAGGAEQQALSGPPEPAQHPMTQNTADWSDNLAGKNGQPNQRQPSVHMADMDTGQVDNGVDSIARSLGSLENQMTYTGTGNQIFHGNSNAMPINMGGVHKLAIPTTASEKNFFNQVYSQPYTDDQKSNLIKAYAQVAPAREALMGRNMMQDNPTDLDGYLRDIVENVA